jgi:hypothetical protein
MEPDFWLAASSFMVYDGIDIVSDHDPDMPVQVELASQATFTTTGRPVAATDRHAGGSGMQARLFAAFGLSLPGTTENDMFKPGTGKRRHR